MSWLDKSITQIFKDAADAWYNDKYEFVPGDEIRFDGHDLKRIRALKDMPEVPVERFDNNGKVFVDYLRKGELGGYIESMDNLSYNKGDSAWVHAHSLNGNKHADTHVAGSSRVEGGAQVKDRSYIRNSVIDGNITISGNSELKDKKITGSGTYNTELYGKVTADSTIIVEPLNEPTAVQPAIPAQLQRQGL